MAVSMVSTGAVTLAFTAGPYLELDEERFMVLREKSFNRLQPDTFIR